MITHSHSERNNDSLNELEITATILRILEGILGKKTRPVKLHDTEEARIGRQRSQIDKLLGLLLSSNYCCGAFAIANLCLSWSKYSHPLKNSVLIQLQAIGQRQELFFQEEAMVLVDSPSPRWPVESTADDESNLAFYMKLLKLEDVFITTEYTIHSEASDSCACWVL